VMPASCTASLLRSTGAGSQRNTSRRGVRVWAVSGAAEVTGDPSRFYELWWIAVALCAAAVVVSLGLTPKRQPAKADVTVPVVAAATDSTNRPVA
jgi:hypothetical protein